MQAKRRIGHNLRVELGGLTHGRKQRNVNAILIGDLPAKTFAIQVERGNLIHTRAHLIALIIARMRIQQLLVLLEGIFLQPAALVHFSHHTAHFRHIIRARRALDKIPRAKHRIIKALFSYRLTHVIKQLRVGVGQNLNIKARLDITPPNALVVFKTILRVFVLLGRLQSKLPLAIVRFSGRLPGVVRLTTQA